jgi:hypothetical protein
LYKNKRFVTVSLQHKNYITIYANMSRIIDNLNLIDYGWTPWILFLTTFALWGFSRAFSNIFGTGFSNAGFGGFGAGGGGVVAPNAAAPGGVVAAPGGNTLYGPGHYISDGLQTLLWLLFVPTIMNQLFGFTNWHARNLIIAIFSIGLIWAILRSIGHVINFLHRIVDLLLLVLVPMALAASILALRHLWGDD